MDSLVTLIARQSDLKLLRMRGEAQDYKLTEEQEQRIRSAVANTSCRVIITDEEHDAWVAEQEEAYYDEESEADDKEQEEAVAAASAS